MVSYGEAYAPFCARYGNFSEWFDDNGNIVDQEFFEKIDRELTQLCDIVNSLNRRQRDITTTSGDLAAETPSGSVDILEVHRITPVGAVGTLVNAIDASVDLVGNVIVDPDGAATRLYTPADYTYDNTEITFVSPPGSEIEYRLYHNMSGVLNRIESVLYGLGAYLVGFPNQLGLYQTKASVGDALDEVMSKLDTLISNIGSTTALLLRDGSRTLTNDWNVNCRSTSSTAIAPVGSIEITGTVGDGDRISINDGFAGLPLVFELDSDTLLEPGSIPVTIDGDDEVTAQNIAEAINASILAINAIWAGAGSTVVNLTHQYASATGNKNIVTIEPPPGTGPSTALTVVGMSGGQNGLLGDLCTSFRIRTHPPSLQDGDVVVHEELQGVLNQITRLEQLFVRLDGQSVMLGDLKMGGKTITGLDKGDLTTAIEDNEQVVTGHMLWLLQEQLSAIDNLFIPAAGRKSVDYSAQAEITGPLGLGQLATAIADETQDENAVVHTWDGVPKPFADDHVANKLYSDEQDQVLQLQIDDIASETGTAGLPPGGCGLGDTTGGLNISTSGEFQTTGDTTITSPYSLSYDTRVRVEAGNLTLSGILTIASDKSLDFDVDGDVILNAAINGGGHITIHATGSVTQSADITANTVDIYAIGGISKNANINAQTIKIIADADSSISGTDAVLLDNGGIGTTIEATEGIGKYGGNPGVGSADGTGGGGGGGTGGGNGGDGESVLLGDGGTTKLPSSVTRAWLFDASGGGGGGGGFVGGGTNNGGNGGGTIIIYITGNLDFTGAIISANGSNGQVNGAGGGGGGGGGCVKVSCTGTITNGAISSNGGNGGNTSLDGGGGGGGSGFIVAQAKAGTQSILANGGNGYDADDGQAGSAPLPILLPEEDIICLRSLLIA